MNKMNKNEMNKDEILEYLKEWHDLIMEQQLPSQAQNHYIIKDGSGTFQKFCKADKEIPKSKEELLKQVTSLCKTKKVDKIEDVLSKSHTELFENKDIKKRYYPLSDDSHEEHEKWSEAYSKYLTYKIEPENKELEELFKKIITSIKKLITSTNSGHGPAASGIYATINAKTPLIDIILFLEELRNFNINDVNSAQLDSIQSSIDKIKNIGEYITLELFSYYHLPEEGILIYNTTTEKYLEKLVGVGNKKLKNFEYHIELMKKGYNILKDKYSESYWDKNEDWIRLVKELGYTEKESKNILRKMEIDKFWWWLSNYKEQKKEVHMDFTVWQFTPPGSSSKEHFENWINECKNKKRLYFNSNTNAGVPRNKIQILDKLQIGDLVIAKSGQQNVYGIGIINSKLKDDKSNNYTTADVEWIIAFEDKPFEVPFSNSSDNYKFHKDSGLLRYSYYDEDDNYKNYKNLKKLMISSNPDLKEEFKKLEKRAKINLEGGVMKDNENIRYLNQIFYGPPGTGKTFRALEIAKGYDYYQIITFHPSYDYTDFVEGIFPKMDNSETLSYETKDGILKKIAAKALLAALPKENDEKQNPEWSEVYEKYKSCKDKIDWSNAPKFLLIIDEINRGDIPRIFGELITIIEEDKRLGGQNELLIDLPYSQKKFGLPKNLYILGTMNTADKSIAHFDVALRRRFVFEEYLPDFKEVEGIPDHVKKNLEELNKKLSEEPDIGWQKQIGHTYFMDKDSKDGKYIGDDELKYVIKNKIIPLLEDYFFYDKRKLIQFLKDKLEIKDIDKLVEWLRSNDKGQDNHSKDE